MADIRHHLGPRKGFRPTSLDDGRFGRHRSCSLALVRRSGLVTLPPLVFWLAGYLCWGWWSGASRVGGAGLRALNLDGLLGYYCTLSERLRPPGHVPLPPSLAAIVYTALEVLSMSIHSSAHRISDGCLR